MVDTPEPDVSVAVASVFWVAVLMIISGILVMFLSSGRIILVGVSNMAWRILLMRFMRTACLKNEVYNG